MHSLTTRARFLAWHRAQLRAATAPPRPQASPPLPERRRLLLLCLLGALALAVVGTALWPDGQTRPLSYSQPEPVEMAGSSAPVYAF